MASHPGADFLAAGVEQGDIVVVTIALDGGASPVPDQTAAPFLVKQVPTSTTLLLVGTTVTPSVDITYSVRTQDFTTAEQAQFMKDYAEAFRNRRVINTVAGRGEVKTIFTGDTWVDAVYANAVIASLVSSLPSQAGLSRAPLPGITDFRSTTAGKFLRSDMNTMGEGGNLILEKPSEAAQVRIRRQNTTDKTTADTAELSITKNVDYVSFVYINALEPFIGLFNIVPSFFSAAQITLDSVRQVLTSNELPGIGPVLLSADIISFAASESEKGVVDLCIDIEPPFPVNKIKLKLIV
jgi:hypothetical protein